MNQVSADTLTQLCLWLGVLLGLLILAVVVVQSLRGGAAKAEPGAGDMLSKFQEMRREGDINEAEYRTIKAVLGSQLQSGGGRPPGDAKSDKDKA